MAFILVQHLDPTHESMMVELLAGHTSMTVLQAADGMPIEPDHLYVIPPGTYLSVGDGALHLSQPQARHGARLPFDFLLHSLAEECGARAICVILSGTGADGSLGLKAVKEKCGLVIAQDPDEAGYDGMPRSAIATGAVDLVLAGGKDSATRSSNTTGEWPASAAQDGSAPQDSAQDWLPEIIESAAHEDRPRFHALQAGHAAAPDRAAHGDGGDRDRRHGSLSRRCCAATPANSTFWPRTC